MDYELLTVEEEFNVGNLGARPCNPDVVSRNDAESIVLLVECKGGRSLDQKQLETYLSVRPSDVRLLATVSNPNKLGVKMLYSASSFNDFSEDMSAKLEDIVRTKSVPDAPKELDILELTPSLVRVHSTDPTWGTELLSGIRIAEDTYPNWFYPFSKDDSSEWKLLYVVRSLLHIILTTNPINPNQITVTTDQIVQDLYEAYSYISSRHRGELRGEIEKCFNRLLREPKMRGLIGRLGTRGRPVSIKDIENARKALQRLAREIAEGQAQTEVEDFG